MSSADYQREWKSRNRARVAAYNAARRHDFPPNVCVVCGELFKPRREHDRYCGELCRNRRPRKTKSSGKRRPVGIRICPCGRQFGWAPRLREKYCSVQCVLDARVGHALEWRCDVPWRTCVECGGQFIHRTAKRCSDECRKAYGRRRYRQTFVSVEITNPEVRHRCPECGVEFTSRKNSSRRKFCSFTCSRRVSRRIRRQRLYSRPHELVGRWEIGERDGWVCQLCKAPVDPDGGFWDRMGPTLDHIIPVSDEGCHVRSNLQIAHRLCNSRKGTGTAQLRLLLEAA